MNNKNGFGMKRIPIEDLKPGVIFDKPVYVNNDILLNSYQPLKKSDYDRLIEWKIDAVYTEGRILKKEEFEDELRDIISDISESDSSDIYDMYFFVEDDSLVNSSIEKHQEFVSVVKDAFEKAKEDKDINVADLRNAANNLVSFVNKNRRISFKLIFAPQKIEEYLYYTGVNTAILGVMTAQTMGYSRLHLINIALGGFLHDIGMTKISSEILYKKEQITPTELNILKKHPFYGYKILRKTNAFPEDVNLIVLQHHERVDGSGYPYGFVSNQISEYSKIIGICDTYLAMCHERSYRKAKTPPLIMKTLLKEEIGKIDPNVLKMFTFTVGVYPVGLFVEITDGSIGEVMLQNINVITKPTVKIYFANNKRVDPPAVLNLAKEEREGLGIKRVLSSEETKELLRKIRGKWGC